MLEENKWYTVQIHLHDFRGENKEPHIEEFKDFNKAQVKEFSAKIFVQGFRVEINPGTSWEIIDPLRIKKVYILTQPQKFGL